MMRDGAGRFRAARPVAALVAAALVAGCGGTFLGQTREERVAANTAETRARIGSGGGALRTLFGATDDPNTTLEVNKYLWAATLDVLSFMPVAQADPFSGVIRFGYGTPPGGGRPYEATVLIQDPALDARSLSVALRTRAGAVDRETQRAVEDAILTRARQIRIADSRL